MPGNGHSLHANHHLAYDYTRSLGPVLGEFFTGLLERRVLGVRSADGRVLVPPQEYDPVTAAGLSEMVEVADSGVVTTWAWVSRPSAKHPLDRPFAFALVRLDGADTPMLHVVDAGDESRMQVGMRVRARWAAEPRGFIDDIEAFEPESEAVA